MSTISAALTYHLAAFALLISQIVRDAQEQPLGAGLFVLALQALAAIPVVALCRLAVQAALREPRSRSWIVAGDLVAFLIALAMVSAVALPTDTSGAAAFGILGVLFWGVPSVLVLSSLSFVVAARRSLWNVLIALVAVDVLLLLAGLGMQLSASSATTAVLGAETAL